MGVIGKLTFRENNELVGIGGVLNSFFGFYVKFDIIILMYVVSKRRRIEVS